MSSVLVDVSVPEPVHVRSRETIGVLFIIDQLCELGGAEKVLLRMVDRLPRERYSPRVVTFKIDPSLGIANSISCPLHVFPLSRTYDRTALAVARQIRGLIREHRVQITHTFHETSDLWAGPIAKISGCPVLISSRRDMGFNRSRKHRLAYRWAGRRLFTEVQTVSEQVRRRNITEDRLTPERVITLYNGVDFHRSTKIAPKSELRKRLGLGDASHLISSVGHIRAVKGFDVLVRTAARVCAEIPGAVFAIAGADHQPAYTERLNRLIASLGLSDHFLFLGSLEDPASLLQASDVFCLLSSSEGLSNALLEAMAYELPCVATAVGGNPEVVSDGKTGFLVGNEDAESAAASVLCLLRDPTLARGMGVEGRLTVERQFTTETMMRRLTESYEQLLCGARRASS